MYLAPSRSVHYSLSEEEFEVLQGLVETEFRQIEIRFIDDDESEDKGFLRVFNEGTAAFDELNLFPCLDSIDWETICEKLHDKANLCVRGNYQFTNGISGGQATERSVIPEEFNIAAPCKLIGTDNYTAEYSAMSNIARAVRVPYASDDWQSALPINAWMLDRFLRNELYFPGVLDNVFGMYTFAMMVDAGLLPHVDAMNPQKDSDIMVVSKVLLFEGKWIRVCIIGAMRKSMYDMYERLEPLRVEGAFVSRYLSDEITEAYQRDSALSYFKALGCEGAYVVQKMDDHGIAGDVVYGTLLQRPHINKGATHIACYINLVRAVHRIRPFTTYELIMAGLIWGQCNALDIPSWVWQQWLLKKLPVSDWNSCLFQQFMSFMLKIFFGVQRSRLTRCQAFAHPVSATALRQVAFQILSLVKKFRNNPPSVDIDGATLKDIQTQFYKALSPTRGRTNIGQLQKGEVIQFWVGIRLINCPLLFNTCIPMYNNLAAKISCIQKVAAIAQAFCVSVATAENILCEFKRLREPIGIFNVGDSFIVVRPSDVKGNACDIIEHIPLPSGGCRTQSVEHFTPRELTNLEEESGINWFWNPDDDAFQDYLKTNKIVNFAVGMGVGVPATATTRKLRFLLTPADLEIARSHVFSKNIQLGITNLNFFLTKVVSRMTEKEVNDAVACVGKKRSNPLHAEVLSALGETTDVNEHPKALSNRIGTAKKRLSHNTVELEVERRVIALHKKSKSAKFVTQNESNWNGDELSDDISEFGHSSASGADEAADSPSTSTVENLPIVRINVVAEPNVPVLRRETAGPTYPPVNFHQELLRPSNVPERRLFAVALSKRSLVSKPFNVLHQARAEFTRLTRVFNNNRPCSISELPSLKATNFRSDSTCPGGNLQWSNHCNGWKPNMNHEQRYDFSIAGRSVLVDKIGCWLGGSIKTCASGNDVPRLVFSNLELARQHLAFCLLLSIRHPELSYVAGRFLNRFDRHLEAGEVGVLVLVRRKRKQEHCLKNGNYLCLLRRQSKTILAFIHMKDEKPDIEAREGKSFYVEI